VTLAQVLIDRVIIDNAGSYESLWLYDEDKDQQAVTASTRRKVTATAKSNVTDMRSDANATSLAKDYRDRLYQNPASLAEVLRIQPAQKDGEMLGYRVSAGRDKQQFADLGFKTNDVVTSINGITLDEPSKALEIYKLMRSAKEATFTIDRNGESVDILVALDEDS
jgi:general secretion pathway protein C